MKKAFTMIELIFVIVIIGIMATVAIPKLAATRDDAKISTEVASVTQVLINLGSEYASQGAFNNYTVAQADIATNCFTATASGSDGVVIGAIGSVSEECSSVVLAGSKNLAAQAGIINSDQSAKTYTFGGISIVK